MRYLKVASWKLSSKIIFHLQCRNTMRQARQNISFNWTRPSHAFTAQNEWPVFTCFNESHCPIVFNFWTTKQLTVLVFIDGFEWNKNWSIAVWVFYKLCFRLEAIGWNARSQIYLNWRNFFWPLTFLGFRKLIAAKIFIAWYWSQKMLNRMLQELSAGFCVTKIRW